MATAVAVSGGADSLYALASLQEAGEDIFALHARFLPPELCAPGQEAALERLEAVCAGLGVVLHVADCVEVFTQKVIRPFVEAYAAGRTPNPCAACNSSLKFGLLLEKALALGADRLATGHYATLRHGACGPTLSAGLDTAKDQSYFLALVRREALSRALFPLGVLRKTDIRVWLEQRGLTPPVPAESQEICFVPNDDYRPLVERLAARYGIMLPGPGPLRLRGGRELGRHAGLWRYTEGQRRGLGIAWSEPLFVLEKDRAANALLVGPRVELGAEGFCCADLNPLAPPETWPQELLLRTRYRQKARPAHMERRDGCYWFRETERGGPYSPGQLATVYAMEGAGDDGGEEGALRVLGGGIITEP